MSMKLGYDLTIEQTQKLVMTPELIQAIQILQFNTQELDSYVQEQLLVNPALEYSAAEDQEKPLNDQEDVILENRQDPEITASGGRDEDFDWKEFIANRQYDDISYRQWDEKNAEEQVPSYEYYTASDTTLPEHLMFQLQLVPCSRACRRTGDYIIESLDENGYLAVTVEEIAKAAGVTDEKVMEALEIVQSLDPPGVGARNLAECLIIQLRQQGLLTDTFEKVIANHLEDLAGNRLSVIAKEMGISVSAVQKMSDVIRTLEPKPGRLFASQTETKYIVPDVFVEKVDDEYVVTVNESSAPVLTVSSYYRKLLKQAESDEKLSEYLSDRVNSALWLIKSIEQRKQTIYNVVSAVVKHQKSFFDRGSKYMKTLTLKEIAEEVGVHESTVSRTVNGKYLQCSRGVFEIRYFFSAGVSGNRGEGISSNSIKEFIREMVEKEDPKSPHSDQDMVDILKTKGISISRRTVAKYRDEMNILSSSKRKRY